MKKTYLIIASIVFITTVVMTETYSKEKEQRISLSSATSTGMYYVIGAGLAELANKYGGLNIQNQGSGGSAANFNLLTKGTTDMGLVGFDAFYEMAIEKKRDVSALRLVMFGTTSSRQFIVRKASGLRQMKDVLGKRVTVGGPGSGTALDTEELLQIGWGITKQNTTIKYLSYEEAIDGVRDRAIDAGLVNFAVPAGMVIDIASSMPIWILDWDKEGRDKIIATEKYKMWYPNIIPANTYQGVDKDITVLICPPSLILCRSALSEDVIYRFVKAVWEHNPDLVAVHPVGREVIFETTRDLWKGESGKVIGKYVDLHPGTKKYMKEREKR